MSNPLAPFFNRAPTADELANVPADELRRVIDAATEAERLNATDLVETRAWATAVRSAAETALAQRK